MATLVYKMTHKGDPDHARGFWGVEDCMGRIRDYDFDAVIGIGGLTWWKRETSRAGEVVWIGIEPQKVPVQGKRGPLVRFAHFHYFLEGELMLSEIAPVLEKSMHRARFMRDGFSPVEKREIERICKLALSAGPSKPFSVKTIATLVHEEELRCKRCRPKRC